MSRFFVFLITIYQKTLSPILAWLGVSCRFYPSCSNYAILAIREDGASKGLIETYQRLKRCRPDNLESCIDFPSNDKKDLDKDNLYALQRSEIIDEKTCNFCLSIDGRTFDKNDPITKIDQFCPHCRGIWVEIMNDEVDPPKIDGIPQAVREHVNLSTKEVIKMSEPIIKENSFVDRYFKNKKS